jgi:hypothetical protein
VLITHPVLVSLAGQLDGAVDHLSPVEAEHSEIRPPPTSAYSRRAWRKAATYSVVSVTDNPSLAHDHCPS